MQTVKTVHELQNKLSVLKEGSLIGFVPTMGALHAGHISLIDRAKAECKYVVCSIFVNPTQFNDPNDLAKYPRPISHDMEMLSNAKCDFLFLPTEEEIYPGGLKNELSLNFQELDKVMEGHFRPGHFDGMAQVVKRLLDIIMPDNLYMGQKDFQQLAIVRSLLSQTNLPIHLIMCETVREPDGLAMSSRNIRLDPKLRKTAHLIYDILNWAKEVISERPISEICAEAMSRLKHQKDFKPEYFEIVDGITLKQIVHIKNHDFVVACIGCWVGEVRLIDNIILKKSVKIL
ncbi:MAG TPA: pantoate--beta-alanine ligase [Saprospiraceae bacterium]|nr:pantoate--beta-alanine ligase [Saprospiraceae bacterium]